jgi:hypothetical protein
MSDLGVIRLGTGCVLLQGVSVSISTVKVQDHVTPSTLEEAAHLILDTEI